MTSPRYLDQEVLSRSESLKMLKQDDANIKIKKERDTEDYCEERCRYSKTDEEQISSRNNFSEVPKDAEYDIVKEKKDTRNPALDDAKARETSSFGNDFEMMKSGASIVEKEKGIWNLGEKERINVSSEKVDIHDVSETRENHWEERSPSNQEHLTNKRKLHELYTEELSLRNDSRTEAQRSYPTTHAFRFEPQLWHHNEERETLKNSDPVYSRKIAEKSVYADPAFARMEFHGMSLDYRLDGNGSKLDPRTNEPIPRSNTYFTPIDPRNQKCGVLEDPRTRYQPDEDMAYRSSCQDEFINRAWYPQYDAVLTKPAGSDHYFKNGLQRGKDDFRSSLSKERCEHYLQLQQGSYWSYFDRNAVRNENQRIALLRAERPREDVNNKTKDYPFIKEQNLDRRTQVEECCNYVEVPNILLHTPSSNLFVNGGDFHGLQSVDRNLERAFPIAEKGSIAFIEKPSVYYPCCKEGLHVDYYEDMAAKARLLDTRHERQRLNAFKTLKPAAVIPQALLFNEAPEARIFHVNRIGNKEQNCQKKSETTNGKLPSPMQHNALKRKLSFEDILTAEKQRLVDENRKKQEDKELPHSAQKFQEKKSLEIEANKEMERENCKIRNEARIETSKRKDVQQSENVLSGVGQMEESMKIFQDKSELQQTIFPEQGRQNQDDSSLKKTISCTVCNKSFNRSSNLYTHMRTHSANKPHACEFCGKRFHQKADLRIHRYIHTGEKPHKCTKCGRGFKQLTHLKYHMRTHSDVRMYKCPYCEKGFNQKSNLQAHIFGHTGQRPHKCDTCGKGFTLASTLNTHKRTHLPNKPFKCEFCDRAFYQKNALKMHYVSTHPYSSGACLV